MLICADVIEHVNDPVAPLSYIRDHLKPGKHLVISTPDRVALRGPACKHSPNKFHIREWSESEFVALLKSEGWHVAEARHFPLVGWFQLNYLAPYYWLRQKAKGLSAYPNLAVYAYWPREDEREIIAHLNVEVEKQNKAQ